MKLTKGKQKEFFKMIQKQQDVHFDELKTMLNEHPELANTVVEGMAKGIDGFSSLQLAVRFFNFKIATELIKAGADINYIDDSPHRPNYEPVFFDLIEMLKNIIEEEEYELVKEGIELWELMEANGLDYSKKSIAKDGVNTPENCVQAFIRLASTEYESKHKLAEEWNDKENKFDYSFSDENREPEKEKWYEIIIAKILENVDEKLIKKVDGNQYRGISISLMPFYEKVGYVDDFSLEITNILVKKKYGYELKNMSNEAKKVFLKNNK